MPYVVERIVAQGVEVNKGRVFIPTGAFASWPVPPLHSPHCHHHHLIPDILHKKQRMVE